MLASPNSNRVIKRVMAFAIKKAPELAVVRHQYCKLAEKDHKKSSRVFAHTFCDRKNGKHLVCWSKAMKSLPAMKVAGICLHELGHLLAGPLDNQTRFAQEMAADVAVLDTFGIEIEYIGKNAIQAIDPRRLGR